LSVEWPFETSKSRKNLTITGDAKDGEKLMIDPLGLSLILFFGSILIIQMIGMLIHRFGTFAHILASVDFITSKRIVGEEFRIK